MYHSEFRSSQTLPRSRPAGPYISSSLAFEGPLHCPPYWLRQCIFQPTAEEGSLPSTPFVVCRLSQKNFFLLFYFIFKCFAAPGRHCFLQLWERRLFFLVASGLPTAVPSLAVRHRLYTGRLGCLMACGIFPDQGSKLCPLPDTPGSPEGNTEGPGTASSEPLLPS